MNYPEALILGLIQGLAEWLPISSSAQSMLASIGLFGIEPAQAFSISLLLHLGTMSAVLVRFRRDFFIFLDEVLHFRASPISQFILLSAVVGAVGYPIISVFEQYVLPFQKHIAAFLGIALLFTAFLLKRSKREATRKTKTTKDVTGSDAMSVGLAQALAILPGVSRSGITYFGLFWRGFRLEDALKLSFLMSVPAVAGAVLYSAVKSPVVLTPELLFGNVVSFVVGYATMELMLQKARTLDFSVFCGALGLLALLLSFM